MTIFSCKFWFVTQVVSTTCFFFDPDSSGAKQSKKEQIASSPDIRRAPRNKKSFRLRNDFN